MLFTKKRYLCVCLFEIYYLKIILGCKYAILFFVVILTSNDWWNRLICYLQALKEINERFKFKYLSNQLKYCYAGIRNILGYLIEIYNGNYVFKVTQKRNILKVFSSFYFGQIFCWIFIRQIIVFI